MRTSDSSHRARRGPALLRNTVVYSSDSDDGECGSGGRARGRGDALPQKKKGRRRTGNVPDLQPPPRIKIAPVRPAKGGKGKSGNGSKGDGKGGKEGDAMGPMGEQRRSLPDHPVALGE